MSHGPLMLDLTGLEITAEEKEMLQHPAAGGVILFSRNYDNPEQLEALVGQIHALRSPSLLVAVDQEGGRVQRFREGFTRLPPAAWFGERHDINRQDALAATREVAWLMASELRSHGVDFSFAPVLDLGMGVSSVIGDRAFHSDPAVVAELAFAWMTGVHEGGMPAVGKHFPGHGGVAADSHLELPVDERPLEDLYRLDLQAFARMIGSGLEAIMPAHVIYPRADKELAGFSRFWLQAVLRKELGFQGVIFSDDLTMAAAEEAGDYGDRADAALEAGCDMVLVCNNPKGAAAVLDRLRNYADPTAQSRLARMHGRRHTSRQKLHLDPRWRKAVEIVAGYEAETEQSLDLQ